MQASHRKGLASHPDPRSCGERRAYGSVGGVPGTCTARGEYLERVTSDAESDPSVQRSMKEMETRR